eukprot:gene17015-23300_t
MHALGNVFGDLRPLWLGRDRVFGMTVSLKVYIDEERRRLDRFHEWDHSESHTAPFVMLKGFWEIANTRLTQARMGAGQSWNDSTSWYQAFGVTDTKGHLPYLDKHDWWLLSGPALAYALTGAWSTSLYESLMIAMCKAMDGLKASVMDSAARTSASEKMVVALATFEQLLPACEVDGKLHQLQHISSNLPCGFYSCWSLERSIRFATSHIKNQAHAAASAAAHLALSMSTTYQSPSRDLCSRPYDGLLEFSIDRQDPVVQMPMSISPRTVALTTKDVVSLHKHYLEYGGWPKHAEYKQLWDIFITESPRPVGSRTELAAALEDWRIWGRLKANLDVGQKQLCQGPSRNAVIGQKVLVGGGSFRSVTSDLKKSGEPRCSTGSYFAAKYLQDMDDGIPALAYQLCQMVDRKMAGSLQ